MNDETKTLTVINCEVYSRVCGYYRPVSGYNPGKKQEFMDRLPVKPVSKSVMISTTIEEK